jgi:polysaccharide export outer membrane protein
VIEVSVWKDEELTKRLVIGPDGKISFPLIGEIEAKGRTIDVIRQEIESKIKAFVPDSPVTVVLREINYPKVYVVGKVNRSGVFTMTGEPLTVLQALALAGGMTDFADSNDIIVIRKQAEGQKVFKFNYGKVSHGKNLEQNIELKPGDTVVIP